MPEENEGFVKPAPKPADTEVKYVGSQAKVFIPSWKEQWIAQGEIITVPAELAERLCDQPANWELVEKAAAPKPKPEKKEPALKGPADDKGKE